MMNERLIQLAYLANAQNDTSVPFRFAEKFAELILNECIALTHELGNEYQTHVRESFDFQDKNLYAVGICACNQTVELIKSRFGLEKQDETN